MINVNYVQSDLPNEDLSMMVEGLQSLTQWNISTNPKYWSESFIDADYIYRIHRPSTRVVEETGLVIQDIVSAEFQTQETIFPDFFQINKHTDNFIRTEEKPLNKICETVTYLNGPLKNQTVIVYNDSDFYAIKNETDQTIYTLSMFWGYDKNPMYRGWFINKYFRKFA